MVILRDMCRKSPENVPNSTFSRVAPRIKANDFVPHCSVLEHGVLVKEASTKAKLLALVLELISRLKLGPQGGGDLAVDE